MKWISADYIKELMKNDRLMQGNAECKLWEQEVDKRVDAMPSIDLVRCGKCKYKDCCSELGDEIDADDYCSFGKRRSDETD